ncbi:hypothetical protein EF888_06215 [Silicimonas algicola]|uniref:Cytochrome c-type biogenesis protein n=1 Tax=Silicimonas algicola TaxID=1826607 RepID=A0A316FYC0_9RHOB|nr:hypothetical protein [Silicimonas algicola]AZQ66770.1 hypothetical protein EF888_06215 [Silicimonas algicola]PWK53115.1 hypothetical protein C8D95_11417 [Silicimonas algicola]
MFKTFSHRFLLLAALASAMPAHAQSTTALRCDLLDNPISARQCMLSQQIQATRIQGDLVKGSAYPVVQEDDLTEEERLAVLRARQQMAEMTSDRVVLAPAGSGSAGYVIPLLLLLLLLGLAGGGGSSGEPVSPS